jgi:hypothetical protein
MTEKPAAPVAELIVPDNLVDAYGDLVKARDAFAATEKAYKATHEKLKALVASQPPGAEFVVRGERYTLRISAATFDRKPDVSKVRKLLGAAGFLEVVSVTMKALEGFLLKPQIEAILIVTQTGPRSYDAVPIAAEAEERTAACRRSQ